MNISNYILSFIHLVQKCFVLSTNDILYENHMVLGEFIVYFIVIDQIDIKFLMKRMFYKKKYT